MIKIGYLVHDNPHDVKSFSGTGFYMFNALCKTKNVAVHLLGEKYLKKQLDIIKPNLIVSLGRVSAMTLLKNNESLSKLRNRIHKYQNIDLIATYHPAALLRNPNLKRDAWEDFKLIKNNYNKRKYLLGD